MKRILSIVFIAAIAPGAFAQLPVSTAAENKNVIIEEYTGIACTYCPDGHRIANEIEKANTGNVFVVNIHTGSYANGTPDFKTDFGSSLASQAGVSGYPAGSVNRKGNAQDRGKWAASTKTLLAEASYANVALQASVNSTTREMIVDVEVYFTANGASTVNLNLALLQDNIEGPQTGGKSYNPSQVLPNGKYNHMHALRHLITGQWGEALTTTTKGQLIKKQYKYTLPASIKSIPVTIKDLHLVAFLAEGKVNIITGNTGPIKVDGTTNVSNVDQLVNQVSVYPNPANSVSNVDFTLKSTENMVLKVANVLGEVVYSTKATLNAGKHSYPVDVTKLNAGIYFVNLTIGHENVTRKINVIK